MIKCTIGKGENLFIFFAQALISGKQVITSYIEHPFLFKSVVIKNMVTMLNR